MKHEDVLFLDITFKNSIFLTKINYIYSKSTINRIWFPNILFSRSDIIFPVVCTAFYNTIS